MANPASDNRAGWWHWYWRPVVVLLTPIILLIIPFILPGRFPHTDKEVFYCLYCVVWMIVYWVTEVIPLPVTSFMPLVFFPYFGIMSGKALSLQYFKETNFVLLGSFLMAAALEESNLHKRIALRIILLMGSDPRWLLLGFHVAGGFLSMWIANAAVTAMLLPCALAVIEELAKFSRDQREWMEAEETPNADTELDAATSETVLELKETTPTESSQESVARVVGVQEAKREEVLDFSTIPANEAHIYRGILLCLCYAPNIGGTATLTGTAPTIVLSGLFTETYRNATGVITYAKWMAFAMPPIIVALILSYLVLLIYIQSFGWSAFKNFRQSNVKHILRRQYRQLGPIRFDEVMSLTGFLCLVLVWFFRDPGFPGFPGWVSIFPKPKLITIGTATMTAAIFLFVIPRHLPRPGQHQTSLLTWPAAQKKVPWGILILVGGGYAMAEGIRTSGLSAWIGEQLKGLDGLSSPVLLFIVVLIAGVMTEFTSNVVVVEVLLPIVGQLAVSQHVNPLYFILPLVLKASFAFMLPVATPPNAIVFNSQLLKVVHMFSVGFFMNVIVTGLTILTTVTYGKWFFDLSTYPSWAPSPITTTTSSILYSPLTTVNITSP